MSKARILAEKDFSVTPDITIPSVGRAEPVQVTINNDAALGDFGKIVSVALDGAGDPIESSFLESPYTPSSRVTFLDVPPVATDLMVVNDNAFAPKSPPVIKPIVTNTDWVNFSFRYLRITEFVVIGVGTGSDISIAELDLWTGEDGTGTNPSNGTVTTTYTHSATHGAANISNGIITDHWWGLGSDNDDAYRLAMQVNINRGASPATIRSVNIAFNPLYANYTAKLYGSDTVGFETPTLIKHYDTSRAVEHSLNAARTEIWF